MNSANTSGISIVRDSERANNRSFVTIDTVRLEDLKPHTFRYKAIHSSTTVLANKLLLRNLNVKSSSICFVEPIIQDPFEGTRDHATKKRK